MKNSDDLSRKMPMYVGVHGKALDSSWAALSVRSRQIGLALTNYTLEVKKGQSYLFGKNLFCPFFEEIIFLGKIEPYWISLVETSRNLCILAIKVQGLMRSRGDTSSSHVTCQSRRIGEGNTLGPSQCPFSFLSNVRGKNAFYLIWPQMTWRRSHWAKTAHDSSRVT